MYDAGTRLVIAALVVAGVSASMFHSRDGSLSEAPVTRVATSEQTVAVTFSTCGAGRRTDCVVDGDTF